MKLTRFVLHGLLLFTLSGCSDVEDPTSIDIDDIVQLRVTGPASVRADGVSMTTVQAIVPADATTRAVKFTTTRGSFLGTDNKAEVAVTADAAGAATATIVSGRDVAVSNVTATVGGFSASVQVLHERAHADAMTAETSSAFATKNGATKPTISALLTRATGQVSLGTRVTFEAFRNGASVGRFSNITPTDANGRATAIFAADTDDLKTGTGDVTIRMTTTTDSGGTLVTETPIRVE